VTAPVEDPGGRPTAASGEADGAILEIAALEARCAALADRIAAGLDGETAASARSELLDLVRAADALRERVSDLRARVRRVAEAWRRSAPPAAAERPTAHHDRLNASSFLERGWSLLAADRHEEAIAALDRALDLDPGSVAAEALLAWALLRAGRPERAGAHLRRVLAKDPRNEMALVGLGWACHVRGIHGEAREHLRRALAGGRDPRAVMYAHLLLGRVHAARREPELAEAALRRAVEAGPSLAEAHLELGALLYRQGRTDEARAAWEEAVARNPYDPHAATARTYLGELAAGRAPALA
jgi:tetratricopeptide (TPR) repeat protein